jgi:hypothetical protein
MTCKIVNCFRDIPNLIQPTKLQIRHCERSEAIHLATVMNCFAALAMTNSKKSSASSSELGINLRVDFFEGRAFYEQWRALSTFSSKK